MSAAETMIGMTVCSGIGAPELSAPWIDWRYQSEIEPFPCAVLAERFPNATNLGDMTKFEEWPDATIDVLCGGTPCQSFSVAGLRKGLGDPRGNLMLTYLAIARRYRPKWVVWENVPGVLSSNKGRDFGSFLGGLGALGYGFAYRVLDAQYVRTCGFPLAVPQRRRRVFVVGYLGDWRRAAAVLFDGESLSGNPAPRREAREVAPTIPARSSGGGGLGTDFVCGGGLIASNSGDVGYCLTTSAQQSLDAETETETLIAVANTLRGEGFDASEDGTGRQNLVTVAQGVALRGREGGGTAELTGPISPALRASTGGGDKPHVLAIQERAVSENPASGPQGAGYNADGAAYTLEARNRVQAVAFAENSRAEVRLCGGDGQVMSQLTTGGGKPGQGQPTIATPWAVRRLTPTECERLMAFPDGWTQVTYRKKPAADGPRYKALGNSWAVNCGHYVFDRIRHVEEITKKTTQLGETA